MIYVIKLIMISILMFNSIVNQGIWMIKSQLVYVQDVLEIIQIFVVLLRHNQMLKDKMKLHLKHVVLENVNQWVELIFTVMINSKEYHKLISVNLNVMLLLLYILVMIKMVVVLKMIVLYFNVNLVIYLLILLMLFVDN